MKIPNITKSQIIKSKTLEVVVVVVVVVVVFITKFSYNCFFAHLYEIRYVD